MSILIVKDLSGNEAPLIVNGLHVVKQLNTLTQLEFSTVNTDDNISAFNMIAPRTIFIDPTDNEIYRIAQKSGTELGQYYQYQITALQIATDLSDYYIHDVLYNTQSINAVMDLITQNTPFKYVLHGSFSNHDFGSQGADNNSPFGNGLAYDLFINSIVKDYNLEWNATGYQINLYNQIGNDNQFVCLDKDDIFQIQESSDFTTLKTRIFGTGKTDDNGVPLVSASYLSPNAKQFGIIDAAPYSDERCTQQSTLLSELKAQLQDYPLVQYQANVNKFKQYSNGLNNDYGIGNFGIVRSRWGIDITTRISKIEYYHDSPSNNDVITFGNLQLDPTNVLVQLSQAHNQLINDVQSATNSDDGSIVNDSSVVKVKVNNLTGTITLSMNNNIVYLNLALSGLNANTKLGNVGLSYCPRVQRSGNLVVSANENYYVNYVIKSNGDFLVTQIRTLLGRPVLKIKNKVSGNLTYLI